MIRLMTRAVFALCALVAMAHPIMAGASDVALTPGKFTVRRCSVEPSFCPSGEEVKQLLIAKNNGAPIFNLVVECAFFQGSDFLGVDRGSTLNVDTGQTAYIEVTSGKAAGADHADCRVFAAMPAATRPLAPGAEYNPNFAICGKAKCP